MARKAKAEEEEEEQVEEEEEEEQVEKKGRGPQPPRISVTVPASLRRKLRIAAARADLEVPEWCRLIVATAAQRTVEKLYGDEG